MYILMKCMWLEEWDKNLIYEKYLSVINNQVSRQGINCPCVRKYVKYVNIQQQNFNIQNMAKDI